MKLTRLALCLALCFLGVAFAQERDAVLERYLLAAENLAISVASLPDNAPQSLDSLQVAEETLRPLASETSSNALVTSMERTFERARTSVRNRSATDLSVQVAVLEGGFGRLLYEAAVREANAGNLALAQNRLSRLAVEAGLPVETQTALAAPVSSAGTLRTLFERGVAQRISSQLETVAALADTDVNAAYETLAAAYGLFIPIQDSPRVPESVNSAFVSAINALVVEEREGFGEALGVLNNTMQVLATAAPVATESTEPAVAEATGNEVTQPVQTQIAELQSDIEALEADAEAAPVIAEETNGDLIALIPIVTAPEGLETEVEITDEIAVEGIVQETTPGLSVIDPTVYGLDEAAQRRLETLYAQNGFGSVEDAVESLYALGARAVTALSRGDEAEAQAALLAFSTTYTRLVGPLLEERGAVNAETEALLGALQSSPALRLQDAVVLIGQVDTVARALVTPLAPNNPLASVETFWAGPLRLALVIALGLLAFVPLYLLRLAFGGGNRNWQWVGVSLVLLLLPIIFEGVSFLGSLLASATGVSALNLLAAFSMFHSPIAHIVWVALTGLAILFATLGLYGICVQFGLLGRRASAPAPSETQTRLTAHDRGPDTIVDWDEEF